MAVRQAGAGCYSQPQAALSSICDKSYLRFTLQYEPVLEGDGGDEDDGAEDPDGEEGGDAGEGGDGDALQRRHVGHQLLAV